MNDKGQASVTSKAIENLCNILELPRPQGFCQDWENEVGDYSRIEEFINCYREDNLGPDEKFTLMIIIIESCNEAVEKDRLTKKRWRQVSKLLIEDMDIHKSTIEYWCVEENEDEMDGFSITPLMRRLKENYIL